MANLRTVLEKLAADFAEAAVAAIQHASLNDIAGVTRSRYGTALAHRGAGPVRAASPNRGRRRHRRSGADIAKVTGAIVALLQKHLGGLRAEQIRAALGISKPELLSP
ncbi:MAG TPA: hypothetical protein VGH28_03900, partial [Polyangiaceae bacterium]